jgi:hypothetical protein
MGALEKILAPARLAKALLRYFRSEPGKNDKAALARLLIPRSFVQREVKAALAHIEITRARTRELYEESPLEPKNRLTAEHEATILYILAKDPYRNREAIASLFRTALPPAPSGSRRAPRSRRTTKRKR